MKHLYKFSVRELLFSGHLQAIGAAGLVFIASFSINGKLPPTALLLVTYLTFQTVYYFDRFKHLKIDKKTNKERTAHIASYRHYLPVLISMMILVNVAISILFLNILSLLSSLTIVLMGFLYPLFIKDLTKYVYFLKNLYVSSIFALLSFSSLIVAPANQIRSNLYLFLYLLLSTWVSQVLLDIKDLDADKERGLKTLPAVMGKDRALFTVGLVSVLSALFFTFFAFQLRNYILVTFSIFVLLLDLLSASFLKKGSAKGLYIAAGKYAFIFVALLLFAIFI